MNDTLENIISINILDRIYKIKCPSSEAHELQLAAQYVDQQMRKIRQSGSNTSAERIAVVTALNICHEMMTLKKQKNTHVDTMNQRIAELTQKVESFLAEEDEIMA